MQQSHDSRQADLFCDFDHLHCAVHVDWCYTYKTNCTESMCYIICLIVALIALPRLKLDHNPVYPLINTILSKPYPNPKPEPQNCYSGDLNFLRVIWLLLYYFLPFYSPAYSRLFFARKQLTLAACLIVWTVAAAYIITFWISDIVVNRSAAIQYVRCYMQNWKLWESHDHFRKSRLSKLVVFLVCGLVKRFGLG